MAEMAEALIDGWFDFDTGEYTGMDLGFPFSRQNKVQQKNRLLRKSEHPRKETYSPKESLFGILKVTYIRVRSNTHDFRSCEVCIGIVKKYVSEELGIKLPKRRKTLFCAARIEEDFDRYMKWLNANYSRK
ncbi:hypothetical protein [Mongoliitalea daihaiensis]|uniref:hypothetical protein n=1 Tax=Mongoliitalea daihaiensis TaxID=2782006 RepID=UPI001F1D949D|nr:hypothetical protein [Mongoliitalea daihaiensis]UJP64032.1 hypothetical protein IPZ59_14555 [Mongoliitalea daihaiensis]